MLLSNSSENNGIVTAVFDGDTIRVKFKNGVQKKVRLIGIDAPELNDSKNQVAFLAYMAKRFTFYHLYKEEVILTYDWQIEDKYGRLLAYVLKGKTLFNEFILREGFASVFLYFPFKKEYQKKFKVAEELARKEGKGFWRMGDFERIKAVDAKHHLGKLVAVEYKCNSIETKRGFVFLNSWRKKFAGLIPQDYMGSFPLYKSLLKRIVLVTGFLEDFRGQPQILIYFPHQVKVIK